MTKRTYNGLKHINDIFKSISSQNAIYQDFFSTYNSHFAFSNSFKIIKNDLPNWNNLYGRLSAFNQVQSILEKNKEIYNKQYSIFLNNNISFGNILPNWSSLYKPFSGLLNSTENLQLIFEKNNKSLNLIASNSIYTTIRCAILESYANTINDCLMKSSGNHKYFEVIEVLKDYTDARLEINDILEKEYVDDNPSGLLDKRVTVSNESLLIEYLEISIKKDENITLEEKKIRIDDISNLGKSIVDKIVKINQLYKITTGNYFFESYNEMIKFANEISQITTTENDFKNIISQIYVSIYEGSGNENRIFEYLPENSTLTLIKYFRHYYDHRYENSNKKRIIEVNSYMIENIGSAMPKNCDDWIKLQQGIYRDLDNMLSEIYTIVEKKYKDKLKVS